MRVLIVDQELTDNDIKKIKDEIYKINKRFLINIDLSLSFSDAEYLAYIRDYDAVFIRVNNLYYKKIKSLLFYVNNRNKKRYIDFDYINKTKVCFLHEDLNIESNDMFQNKLILKYKQEANCFTKQYFEEHFSVLKFLNYEEMFMNFTNKSFYLNSITKKIIHYYLDIAFVKDIKIEGKNYYIFVDFNYLRKFNLLNFLTKINVPILKIELNKHIDFKIFIYLLRHYREVLSLDNIICGLSPEPELSYNYSIESSFSSIRKSVKKSLPQNVVSNNFNPILNINKVGYRLCF
jgi:hypothetical protein